jgi:hypothetical protein
LSILKDFVEWLKLYVLAFTSTLAIILLVTLVYAAWAKMPFLNVLRWTLILGIIVLVGIGAVSLIPLSQYTYVRRGAINPAIIRAGMDDMRRESDPKKIGIVLGLVGLSLTAIYLLVFPL